MSCCGLPPTGDERDEVSRLVSAKLAAFLRTLRDNAFAVGLREGQDAAALMATGYAQQPGLLRSAFKHLFSARKADWERFDGLFDAFWLGKRARSRSTVSGSATPQNNPAVRSLQDAAAQAGGTGGGRPDSAPVTNPAPTSEAAKAAWKAPQRPKTSPTWISGKSPIRSRWRRPMPSQRGWPNPCAQN